MKDVKYGKVTRKSFSKIGDYIDFISRSTDEVIHTIVDNLYYYDSFRELYKNHDKVSLGYDEDEEIDYKDMEKYYPKEEQDEYGVVGIKIRVLK